MGDLISYLLHQGIVRVLFVPIVMIAIIGMLWVMAAPPQDLEDEDEGHAQKS
jgi:hypothetical protein